MLLMVIDASALHPPRPGPPPPEGQTQLPRRGSPRHGPPFSSPLLLLGHDPGCKQLLLGSAAGGARSQSHPGQLVDPSSSSGETHLLAEIGRPSQYCRHSLQSLYPEDADREPIYRLLVKFRFLQFLNISPLMN